MTTRGGAIGAVTRGLSQQGRLLKLDTPAGNNVLLVHRVIGRSRIGRDFFFMLDCVSASGDVELKTLIAQAITLWIQQTDGSYLPHHGYVHTARRLGADGMLTSYQLTFSSWMHFLKFRRDQRHWQEKSVDEIITDVFNQHPQARGMYRFALSKPLPTRSYCRQDDSDWNFVHRLLESEGLYGFWQQAPDGKSHTLVITDRLETFDPLSPPTVRFYRAGTGSEADALTQWSGTRTLQSVMLSTRTFDYKSPSTPFNPKGTSIPTEANQGALPAQAEIYEYTGGYTYPEQDRGDHLSKIRMEEWESQAKRFHGVGSLRAMDAGRRFTLTDHPEHDHDTAAQREFATIEVEWAIENNLPLSGHEASYPNSLSDQFAQSRTNGDGQAFSVNFADGSTGFYRICIEAQRTTVPYRSPFEHSKPEAKLESAIVAGPKGQEAYTDELNRVKVLFIWDRLNPGDESASCWVRVAQSDTGDGYGGVHMPRAGEELLIGHIGNDIDRPIALHRVYNGAAKPSWHSNALLSGYQSSGFGGTGAYNAFVHDDATHQGGTRIVSYTGKSYSSLAQGYLIQQDGNTRGRYIGSGVLLHADDYVSMRAAKGVSIGSHSNAYDDEQLSVDGARGQLTHAGMLVESLSSASATAQAESLQIGQDALKGLTTAIQHPESGQTSGGTTAGGGTGSANGFAKPEIVIASAADFAAVADGSAHVVAQAEVNVVGSGNVNVAAGKSLIAAVAETISIFVQKAGMKLFSAKGPIKISAHTDDMGINAGQTMTVTAKRIVLDATDELIIKCGGSYTRWVAAGIEDGTRGARTIKSASFSRQGPSSIAEHMNSLPQARFNDPYVLRDRITGEVLKNHPYELVRADGTRLTGMTNEQGHVPEQKSEDVESVMLRALRPRSNAGGGSA